MNFGKKEDWTVESIGKWVTHGWHTHPVWTITLLRDVRESNSFEQSINIQKKAFTLQNLLLSTMCCNNSSWMLEDLFWPRPRQCTTTQNPQ
jgi:hypothetical protein